MTTPDHELATFRARLAQAYKQRVDEKIADGLTPARAARLAAAELAVEGDRELPPGLLSPEPTSD